MFIFCTSGACIERFVSKTFELSFLLLTPIFKKIEEIRCIRKYKTLYTNIIGTTYFLLYTKINIFIYTIYIFFN